MVSSSNQSVDLFGPPKSPQDAFQQLLKGFCNPKESPSISRSFKNDEITLETVESHDSSLPNDDEEPEFVVVKTEPVAKRPVRTWRAIEMFVVTLLVLFVTIFAMKQQGITFEFQVLQKEKASPAVVFERPKKRFLGRKKMRAVKPDEL